MTLVHVPTTTDVDLSTLSLAELATHANSEHEACEQSVGLAQSQVADALRHAIRAGEILVAAQTKVPFGDWKGWVTDNVSFSVPTSFRYSRIAMFRTEVEAWAASVDTPSILGAFQYLTRQGLRRAANGSLSRAERDPLFIPQIKALRAEGLTYTEIGKQLDAAPTTVHRAIDPKYRAHRQALQHNHRKRKEAADAALAAKQKRDERNALARSIGGELSKAYSGVRRLASSLDSALAAAEPAHRPHVRDALAYAHKAEDAIIDAMKAQPG